MFALQEKRSPGRKTKVTALFSLPKSPAAAKKVPHKNHRGEKALSFSGERERRKRETRQEITHRIAGKRSFRNISISREKKGGEARPLSSQDWKRGGRGT